MSGKLKSVVMYVGINGLFLAGLYYGMIVGVEWCANLFMFGVALNLIFTAVVGCMAVAAAVLWEQVGLDSENATNFLDKTNNSIVMPIWLDLLIDGVIIVTLASLGHLWMALAVSLQFFLLGFAKNVIKNMDKKANDIVNHEGRWTQPEESDDDDDDLRRLGVLR